MTTKLKAPDGTIEANIGQTQYLVNPEDGTIEADDKDVAQLETGAMGFTRADPVTVSVPQGFVKMSGQPHSSCSLGSESFTADEKGEIFVPASMTAVLLSHGFRGE